MLLSYEVNTSLQLAANSPATPGRGQLSEPVNKWVIRQLCC